MKRTKMKLKLVPSKKMDADAMEDPSAHDTIRMPKAARKHFCPSSDVLQVATGATELMLRSRQAYITDVRSLTEDKKYNIGFVTTKVYEEIQKSKSKRNVIWLSENLEDLVIGSDPEFGLIHANKSFVYARHQLPGKQNSKFGTDGPCMELRADPASSIEGHCKNIRSLLEEGSGLPQLNNLRWWTGATYQHGEGSRRFTLGGHIHIGDPKILSVTRASTPEKTLIYKRIIRVLDELVGSPLTRIDVPEAGWRRTRTPEKYGSFGDFRHQANRFEWRTPSAVWLTHPDLAICVMGTVKAVAEECYGVMENNNVFCGRGVSNTNVDWLSKPAGTADSFLNALGCMSDKVIRKKINESSPTALSENELLDLHTRLRKMSSYPRYKAYVDEFIRVTSLKLSEVNKIKLDAMKENWLANGALIRG